MLVRNEEGSERGMGRSARDGKVGRQGGPEGSGLRPDVGEMLETDAEGGPLNPGSATVPE